MCSTCPNISLVHQHIKISAMRWWQLSPCISDQPPTKTISTSLSIIMLMAFSQMLMMKNEKWWNTFCWCSTLTTPLQIETCNFSTEEKFVEFNMRLMGNLGNSSFYSNCMLFLVWNVIFFPLIVSRKRPAVLNFSYGRGWGGGLRGAQGTLLPVFFRGQGVHP